MEWRRSPPPHGIGVVPVVLKDLMETHILQTKEHCALKGYLYMLFVDSIVFECIW